MSTRARRSASSENQANPESQWFGYQRISPDEKTRKVEGVFASVADKYDLMNDIMSGGIHRLWKDEFIRMIRPRGDLRLLDVAGGTGDISFRYMEKTGRQADITVCDLSREMLEVGKRRAIDRGILSGIEWVHGNAEKLPFPDLSFDVYTIAFGLRNVTRIDNALAEAFRVLKPGGRFFCLEFSRVGNPVLSKLYDAWSFGAIPKIGRAVAGDEESYQYLAESIRKFPDQENLKSRLEKAGFERVSYRNFTGGIAAVHTGHKL